MATTYSIGIVTPTVSRAGGGIFPIVLAHARELHALGHRVTVHGLDDDPDGLDRAEWDDLRLKLYQPGPFGYAKALSQDLMAGDYQLLHQHALWLYPSIAVSRWRARTGSPVVISTQGMLEPWALSNSAWKKRLAAILYEGRSVRSASAIHCSQAEVRGVRAFAPRSTIAVIPNGTDLPSLDGGGHASTATRKTLLFFGRLHPKKGVAELIEAWALLKARDPGVAARWRLVVAGWDDGGHEAQYRAAARELGLDAAEIAFPGPHFGAEKDELLKSADAFILPSYSEGFPMAVLEAWSYALPVFMTRECNIHEGFAAGAAVQIDNVPAALADTLLARLSDDGDLPAMGQAGRRLVESTFSWPAVAADLAKTYRWLIDGGEPPECVDLANASSLRESG